MIDFWIIAFFGGCVVLSSLAIYRWGQKDERFWWTAAADSDYHMRHVDGRDYTVLHASEFVDKYHNPLARYRRSNPVSGISVRGHFP